MTLYSKFCATCGAKLDGDTQALKYYFNEGCEYVFIRCFLLKYHKIEISLRTLKERFIIYAHNSCKKPPSVFTFMSTIWAKHAASSEQDGGRTATWTTKDAFPHSSIQSLATLFGFGVCVSFKNSGWGFLIRTEFLEFGLRRFLNWEGIFRIRSDFLEFGVSF